MSFTPSLFISIGETSAFFTLRETYLHVRYVGNAAYEEVRSFHHFNLSQNPVEALKKANQYSENMGVMLQETSVHKLETNMRDIKRMNKEEVLARQERLRQQEEDYNNAKEERIMVMKEKLNNGIFAFGSFSGMPFAEASRGYITWLINKLEEFEEDSPIRWTAEAVKAQVPELALPVPKPDMVVGTPKKRMEFNVTVTRSITTYAQDYYGRPTVKFITTMVTDDGACLVCFSSAFAPKAEEVLKIKATVKDHNEYNGQAQTIIQRVAVL